MVCNPYPAFAAISAFASHLLPLTMASLAESKSQHEKLKLPTLSHLTQRGKGCSFNFDVVHFQRHTHTPPPDKQQRTSKHTHTRKQTNACTPKHTNDQTIIANATTHISKKAHFFHDSYFFRKGLRWQTWFCAKPADFSVRSTSPRCPRLSQPTIIHPFSRKPS